MKLGKHTLLGAWFRMRAKCDYEIPRQLKNNIIVAEISAKIKSRVFIPSRGSIKMELDSVLRRKK